MQISLMPRRRLFFAAAAVALLSFAIYLPSLGHQFLDWDDGTYVLNNRNIQSLDLHLLKWAFSRFHSGNWHPVTWISHAIDWAAWGNNPLGHHLGNNLLHALNSALVTVLTFQLITVARSGPAGEKTRGALLAAAVAGILFGLHPVHVESVAWVAERKDLLCAFFYILTLIVYLRPASAGKTTESAALPGPFTGNGLLCLVLFALALLSKPMAVSLPLVLLLLDWYPLGRINTAGDAVRDAVSKLPFIALSLASCVVTIFAQKSGGAIDSLAQVPAGYRLALAAKSPLAYLEKLLWPLDLTPFYPLPDASQLFSLGSLAAMAVVLAITIFCLVRARVNRLWLALWIYYAVTLLPVSGVVQIGRQAMADRYAYLPGLAFFVLAGIGAAEVSKRWKSGAVLVAAACLLLGVGLGWLTVRQLGVWQDSITFWNFIISRGPTDQLAFAYNNRGIAWAGQGNSDQAAKDFEMAVKINPNQSSYLKNRGLLLLQLRRWQEALADFQKVIALTPNDGEAYYNIACIDSLENRTAEACDWLRKGVEHGYRDWKNIKQDKDLDNIRSSACYREIVKGR